MEPAILTGEELVEVLEESMPEFPDFIRTVRAYILEEPSDEFGYAVAETLCAYCGESSFAVYAVPTPFPTLCPYCNQRAAYITRTPDDLDEE